MSCLQSSLNCSISRSDRGWGESKNEKHFGFPPEESVSTFPQSPSFSTDSSYQLDGDGHSPPFDTLHPHSNDIGTVAPPRSMNFRPTLASPSSEETQQQEITPGRHGLIRQTGRRGLTRQSSHGSRLERNQFSKTESSSLIESKRPSLINLFKLPFATEWKPEVHQPLKPDVIVCRVSNGPQSPVENDETKPETSDGVTPKLSSVFRSPRRLGLMRAMSVRLPKEIPTPFPRPASHASCVLDEVNETKQETSERVAPQAEKIVPRRPMRMAMMRSKSVRLSNTRPASPEQCQGTPDLDEAKPETAESVVTPPPASCCSLSLKRSDQMTSQSDRFQNEQPASPEPSTSISQRRQRRPKGLNRAQSCRFSSSCGSKVLSGSFTSEQDILNAYEKILNEANSDLLKQPEPSSIPRTHQDATASLSSPPSARPQNLQRDFSFFDPTGWE